MEVFLRESICIQIFVQKFFSDMIFVIDEEVEVYIVDNEIMFLVG